MNHIRVSCTVVAVAIGATCCVAATTSNWAPLWKSQMTSSKWTESSGSDPVYVAAPDIGLAAFSSLTGELTQSYSGIGNGNNVTFSTPAVDLSTGAGVFAMASDGSTFAVALDAPHENPPTLLWRDLSPNTSSACPSSPVTADRFRVFSYAGCQLRSLGADWGQPQWSFQKASITTQYLTGPPIPTVSTSAVLLATSNAITAVSTTDGKELWQFFPSHAVVGAAVGAPPTVDANFVYVPATTTIIGVSVHTGKVISIAPSLPNGTELRHPPVVCGGVVAAVTNTRQIFAFTAATLQPAWTYKPASSAWVSGMACDPNAGLLYFGDEDGTFWALSAKSGIMQASFNTGSKAAFVRPSVGSNGVVTVGQAKGYFYGFKAPQ